jgi:CheY-like chemotaxis protein
VGNRGYVLVVEDEVGLADVVAALLTERGYEVTIAGNGKLGLESLAIRRADLVLTDAMMPVMSGPDMIRHMRADERFHAIPTILMTALREAIPSGDDAQHDAVLLKPFTLGELLAVMAQLIKT